MLNINDSAPGFSLRDQDGNLVSLGDFRGKWVVVYFYPKDDTPGCTEEACSFRDAKSALDRAGIVVLGISKDTVTSHKKFADKYNLNFRILSDPETKVIQAYGAWQEKSMYGKKYMGIQRMTYVINPIGLVEAVFPKVTPKGHEADILTAVEVGQHKDSA
jgi:thioredoxin-dependent peroxiredoxin